MLDCVTSIHCGPDGFASVSRKTRALWACSLSRPLGRVGVRRVVEAGAEE